MANKLQRSNGKERVKTDDTPNTPTTPNTHPTHDPEDPTWPLPDKVLRNCGTKWKWVPYYEEWAYYDYNLREWHSLNHQLEGQVFKSSPPSEEEFSHTFESPSASRRLADDCKTEAVPTSNMRMAADAPQTTLLSAALPATSSSQTLDLIMDQAQARIELAKAPDTQNSTLTPTPAGESSDSNGSGHSAADKITKLEGIVAEQAEIINKLKKIFKAP